ncbi:MAG: hypothetical protein WBE26_06650 [Phycisphaerae bacterium]
MNETPYNPDDPAFLASRSLDEDLPECERRRLDEASASSESLRSEAQQLRAVDHLVKRWGAQPVELDWDHHAALIRVQAVSEDDAEELRKVDHLLQRWRSLTVPLDEGRFTAAVMASVESHRARASRYGLIFRLGAPLAAAAAIAFALTTGMWFTSPQKQVCRVVLGPSLSTVGLSQGVSGASKAVVLFGRDPVDPTPDVGTGISFGSVGASPIALMPEDGPPL